ncbi:FtsX-like permease family protein [Paenibacillus anaericanus]|uniref:FtsX-like permease family protein n=1 Tax=Paenibacillus anaericanus TaxID=170367 RepID=A0A433Y5A9_9BACL|nr:FtsX-like permease family protein [Paenibacillus anaericanus]RUT43850.1 FtsX-like permease family protein [Paenibacillus anaericanus]
MISTGNGKSVSNIARKSLKANRMRNLMIVCAIVLTTLLLTSVFTMALSVNKSMELASMKTVGSDFHGGFKYLNQDEVAKLIQHPSIKEYSRATVVGDINSGVFKNNRVEINFVDENHFKHSFIHFIEGGLPSEENEIAMNTWELDLLGAPHEIGTKVNLDIDIDGTMGDKVISQDFVVSGYFEADQYVAMSGLAYVSEAFVQKNIADIDTEISKADGSYTNTIRLDVMFNNSLDIEGKVKKVLSDTGIDAPYGVNWAYASVSIFEDWTNIIPYVVLIFIIMLSGYLLIYNIFHISVVRDIKFYGLLKTIGTTPKQLRKVISIQANRLYLIALPIGLAAGYGVGCWITPMMTSSFSMTEMEASYSVNPLIFIGAALFSYMTVRIAASKPGRTASKISPVEAVRYAGISSGGSRKKTKRSVNGAKLSRMSLGNILRNKKKLFLMLASLSLSIILFSIIFTVISSFDVNKYLNTFISGDLVMKEESFAGSRNSEVDQYMLTEEVTDVLGKIDGVESLDKVYYQWDGLPIDDTIRSVLEPLIVVAEPHPAIAETLESGVIRLQLHGIEGGWYDVLKQKEIMEGTFDRAKFDSGDYVMITEAILDEDVNASYYHPGDKIKLGSMGKSYEVMAVLKQEAFYAAGAQRYSPFGFNVYLPANEMKATFADAQILSVTLHVNPAKLDEVDRTVRAVAEATKGLNVRSREDYRQEMAGFMTVFKTVGYSLSFIIGLIGVLNYINTVITGVVSRRNEFATLESIGMTKKQMKRMLVYEGFYSILLTALIVGTLGMFLTYQIAKTLADNLAWTVFRMNAWPIVAVILILMVIAYIVTITAYRMLSKSTIVERLRVAE